MLDTEAALTDETLTYTHNTTQHKRQHIPTLTHVCRPYTQLLPRIQVLGNHYHYYYYYYIIEAQTCRRALLHQLATS